MKSFLKEVLDYYLEKTDKKLENTTFILPGKRAGSFLKHLLKIQTDYKGFTPEILSIEELISQISGLKNLDNTNTLFRFYQSYLEFTPKKEQEDFETFYGWAQTLIHDFNEIDRYLIPTKSFFNYLSEIKNIEHWSVAQPQTEIVKNYLKFWNKLSKYHTHFVENLLKNKEAYQGLSYRKSVDFIGDFLQGNKNHFVFIGFNALNNAEQKIIQHILKQKRGEIFWDIDEYFFKIKNHQTARFIKKYKEKWTFYAEEKNEFKWISDNYRKDKNIEIIGIPQNIGQAKYVGQILQNSDLKNTAVILNEEDLLFPVLNSLPDKVKKVNITMGLALDKTPPASLFEILFKIQNDENSNLYYKDVLDVLTHPTIKKSLKNTADETREEIIFQNQVFIKKESILENVNAKEKEILKICFTNYKNDIQEFISQLILLTELLRPENTAKNELEIQYLYHFNIVFKKLSNLLEKYNPITKIKAFQRVYKDLLQTESLDFSGTPFDGLQIMGMLESRVLDFETIILTSVNEGILPGGKSANSFIPNDLKYQYKLPTYKEKDAVYTYHFYRLLQRAKNIYILYDAETSGLNAGEKSRFITQLEVESPKNHQVKINTINPKINSKKEEEKEEFIKTSQVLDLLKKQAAKGFSPSALTTYIRNPLDFYKNYILKIKEEDEVEEIVSAKTLGTVVHDVLEDFYKKFENRNVEVSDIDQMIAEIEVEVEKKFKKLYSKAPLSEGKNLIIFEVAKRFLKNFLLQEKRTIKKDKLTILHIESDNLKQKIDFPEFDFPVYIQGKVDRVDELGKQIRVVDYKTGKVENSNLKVKDFELLTEEDKYNQAFQVLCYASMLQNKRSLKNIQAGIISFKNLKSGFMPFKYDDKEKGKNITEIDENTLDLFQKELKALIREIFNPEIPFKEREN